MHKVLKRAQKEAKTFELQGFNSAWQRLQLKPELHLPFWAWFKTAYAALPKLHNADVRIGHILQQLAITPAHGVLKVDLHGLHAQAAVATAWHFIATAACDTVILFVTGRGKHSPHYKSVLLQHLQTTFKKAYCDHQIPAGQFSVRVTCTSDTQRKLDAYLSKAASNCHSHARGRLMQPSKQHNPGHAKYDRQQRVLQDRKKKQERSLHAALRLESMRATAQQRKQSNHAGRKPKRSVWM